MTFRSKKRFSGARQANFNENDREQLFTPSRELFEDFCLSLVDRYNLHDIVRQANVKSVTECRIPAKMPKGFCITYEGEHKIYAKRVVVAIGSNNIPNIPAWVQTIPGSYPTERLCHSLDLVKSHEQSMATMFMENGNERQNFQPNNIVPRDLEQVIQEKSKKTRLLVVGGGLTSAQAVNVAAKTGFDEIILISRSYQKLRQFDVPLEWMGRFNTLLFAKFWTESNYNARLQILRTVRSGGSMTPEAKAVLDQYECCGKLKTYFKSTVKQAQWNSHNNMWTVDLDNNDQLNVDQIWLCTGSVLDIEKEEILEPILRKHPINIISGLPVLTSDLQWSSSLDLFIMSGYSALTLGPVAQNIIGGRLGAERIANVLLREPHENTQMKHPIRPKLATMADVVSNMSNYFSALVDADA